VLAGERDVDALTGRGVSHRTGADDITDHDPQFEDRRGVVEMDRHAPQAGDGYLDLDLGAALEHHLSVRAPDDVGTGGLEDLTSNRCLG
jgi:hypothetical protein